MKPRSLALLSGCLTLGFGYWLAEHSRDSREIWSSVGAWVLGFWFASSLLANSAKPPEPNSSEYDDEDDEEDDEYEEEYEDDDEYESEEDDEENSR